MARRLAQAGTALLLFVAIGFQWMAARVLLGGSLEKDQAKHFTSGVMVFDYLRSGRASNPMRFAESFEVKYPLVAIGQWPPMYYAIQSVYYFVAGPSIRSAQILSAMMALLLAILLFRSLRSAFNEQIALIAVAVLLATPLIQMAAWQVMSDLLTGLFIYLAIGVFAKLLDDPSRWGAALMFVLYCIAALLSKGSAWALGPFVVLAPLLADRRIFFRSRWFWTGVSATFVAGGIYYLWTKREGIGYHADLARNVSPAVGFGQRIAMLHVLLSFAPSLLLLMGFAGLAIAFHRRWKQGDESPGTTLSLVAGAWLLSQLLFFLILPLTWENRVLLPSLAPLTVLAAQLMAWLQKRLHRPTSFFALAPVALGAMLLTACGAAPVQRLAGYREIANAMPYPPDGALILVATGDGSSEGAVITERLSSGRAHKDVILRGSHDLAAIDEANHETLLMKSTDAVKSYLIGMPIRFIVLDSPPFTHTYESLIDAAVTADPQNFHLVGTFPIFRQPGGEIAKLRLYENPAGRDHHPEVVTTRLGPYAGGRVLTYHW